MSELNLNANMTRLREEALKHLAEARRLLEAFMEDPEFRAGMPAEFAFENLEDAIAMLTPWPDEPEEDDAPAPPGKLRIVSGGRKR